VSVNTVSDRWQKDLLERVKALSQECHEQGDHATEQVFAAILNFTMSGHIDELARLCIMYTDGIQAAQQIMSIRSSRRERVH